MYERWGKIINISVSMDYHDNNGHPISKGNTIFTLIYFNLQFHSHYKFPVSSTFQLILSKMQIQCTKGGERLLT